LGEYGAGQSHKQTLLAAEPVEKGLRFSPREALAAVKSIGVAELDLNGEKKVLVSSPKPHARGVLGGLGITPPKAGLNQEHESDRHSAMGEGARTS